MGGTMRLGSRVTVVAANSLASEVYGFPSDNSNKNNSNNSNNQFHEIHERHRHRYEVNPEKVAILIRNINGFIIKITKQLQQGKSFRISWSSFFRKK